MIGDGGGPLVCPQPGLNFNKLFPGPSSKNLGNLTNKELF